MRENGEREQEQNGQIESESNKREHRKRRESESERRKGASPKIQNMFADARKTYFEKPVRFYFHLSMYFLNLLLTLLMKSLPKC